MMPTATDDNAGIAAGRTPRHLVTVFAPVFSTFGAKVCKQLLDEGSIDRVTGLCIGGSQVVPAVSDVLDGRRASLHDIDRLEWIWANSRSSDADQLVLTSLEAELGTGAVGRTIASDRRLGAAFVTGGSVRPSWLKNRSLARPLDVPTRLVARLYRFLDQLLRDDPDVSVFLYAVAGAPAYLISLICEARGIPIAVLKSGRMSSLRFLDSHHGARWYEVERVATRAASGELDLRDEEAWASRYLAEFRERRHQPASVAIQSQRRANNRIDRLLIRGTRGLVRHLGRHRLSHGIPRSYDSLQALQRFVFEAHVSLRAHGGQRRLNLISRPPQSPYIYFPLHVDPESSTMVLAPYYQDQYFVIQNIAKSMPANYRLIVKEHAPMAGRRPHGFLKRISRLPRVEIADSSRPGIEWVAQSSLTVTITGTAALEAVLLGVPALVIGDSPVLGLAQGYIRESDPSRFPIVLDEAMRCPPIEEREAVRFLAALKHVSFDSNDDPIWSSSQGGRDSGESGLVLQYANSIVQRLH